MAAAFPTTMPALNISHWSPENVCLDTFSAVLSILLPQMTRIPLTIENLNEGPLLMPVRDVAAGELDWGLLQLPKGSQVKLSFIYYAD